MHPEVLDFFRRELPVEAQRGKAVLEIGSLDCGGSLREVITDMAEYTGLDMRSGPKVDTIARAESFQPGRTYDVVVSAGTLEHCEDWKGVLANMKRLTSPGGQIVLTTVSPGFPRHNYPSDYWRWTKLQMARAFADFHIKALEGSNWDVFIRAVKPLDWTEVPVELEASHVDS